MLCSRTPGLHRWVAPSSGGDLGKSPTGRRAADALPRPLPVPRGFGVRPAGCH